MLWCRTVQLDAHLVGGPSEGHAARGGGSWEGGAAEEDVGGRALLQGAPLAQRRQPLAPVDALVRQRAVQRAAARGRARRGGATRGGLMVERGSGGERCKMEEKKRRGGDIEEK